MTWPETLIKAWGDANFSICVVGCRGSLKTTWAIWRMLMTAKAYAHISKYTRFIVVRNSYRELKDTTMKTLFYWFPHKEFGDLTHWKKIGMENPMAFGDYKPSDELYIYEDKDIRSEFFFRSAETEDDIKKFKSFEVTGYHLDEACEMQKEVKLILDPCCRFPLKFPRYLSLLTTNPPNFRHWIYKDYFENPLVGHSGYKQQPREGEPWVGKEYYDNLERSYANNPDWIKRYINGDWGVVLEGEQVYPDWNTAFHSARERIEPVKNIPIIRGWDIGGLTPACAFLQVMDDTTVNVLAEMEEFNCSMDTFGDMVNSFSMVNFSGFSFIDYCDPAGFKREATDEKTCVQVLRRKNIHPKAGEITFKGRKNAVDYLLHKQIKGRGAIRVSPECTMILEGFMGGYHYPRSKSNGEVLRDKPLKNEYSHIIEALEYAVSRIYQTEISQNWYDKYLFNKKKQGRQYFPNASPWAA